MKISKKGVDRGVTSALLVITISKCNVYACSLLHCQLYIVLIYILDKYVIFFAIIQLLSHVNALITRACKNMIKKDL